MESHDRFSSSWRRVIRTSRVLNQEPSLILKKFILHPTMDTQPSTSTGIVDQRRKDALKAYREVFSTLPSKVGLQDADVIYSYPENAAA
jgi:hypothetical protein